MTDKTEHAPIPEAFAALGVRPSILKALGELKYTVPSEIQTMLIPRALAGVDILGQARTGTGKTAAFAIPILQKCERGKATQAIALVPTRELAVQVQSEIERLGQYTPIRSIAVYGGQKITAQMKFLKNHPEVIVGTPGRVIDLLDRRILSFENIRFVVLDEVDRMLDIGFRDDIRNILSRIKGIRHSAEYFEAPPAESQQTQDTPGVPHPDSSPGNAPSTPESGVVPPGVSGNNAPRLSNRRHQTMFVSATISDEIEKLSRRYMQEPIEKLIAPGADASPTVATVEQYYLSVQPWDKYRLLKKLLLQENPDLAIVFCRTKHGAQKLAGKLEYDGIECREIHGDLDQSKRDRVMKSFRGGKFDVLVATDLASRGIDVADISHIINFDIPEDPEVYIHRVGRTARMGAAGRAFTFVTREQGDELDKVESLINMVIPQGKVEGFEPNPTPADWTPNKPGSEPGGPSKPVVSRFERPYGAKSNPAPAASAVLGNADAPGASPEAPAPTVIQAPLRTIGSKIPINRRHKRRR